MNEAGSIAGGEAYEELGELYDVWCAEVVEDLPFYTQLARALAGEQGRDSLDVVELGGGSGRVTIPLAVDGHRVTAIDASPAQLARLRDRASEAGVERSTCAIVGDMRALAQLVPPGSADLVLVPFRGMLHVTAERDAVLAAIHRCLRPGGVVAFDVFHPSAAQVGATDGHWLDRREETTSSGRWRFQERARYRPHLAAEPGGLKLEVDVRCRWRRSRRLGGGSDPAARPDPVDGTHERTALLELQLVPAERWHASLTSTGYVVDGSYGWFDARPLAPHDDDSIWVARRD